MKHSLSSAVWLGLAFSLTCGAWLVGCSSDDGYLPSSTADAAGSADAPFVVVGDPDASVVRADAPAQVMDGGGKDAVVENDAAVADSGMVTDAGGDSALLAPLCDIYDTQSCPAPNMKCDLARDPVSGDRYLACRTSGPKVAGEVCTGGSQCGRGLVCISTSGTTTCRQVCDATDGVPGCAVSGQTCAGRSATYGVTFCL